MDYIINPEKNNLPCVRVDYFTIKDNNGNRVQPWCTNFMSDGGENCLQSLPEKKYEVERSHRALHNFERHIIDHFRDRIVDKKIKRKKFGNKFMIITVYHLDITLDELNTQINGISRNF